MNQDREATAQASTPAPPPPVVIDFPDDSQNMLVGQDALKHHLADGMTIRGIVYVPRIYLVRVDGPRPEKSPARDPYNDRGDEILGVKTNYQRDTEVMYDPSGGSHRDPTILTTLKGHVVYEPRFILSRTRDKTIEALRVEVKSAKDGWNVSMGDASNARDGLRLAKNELSEAQERLAASESKCKKLDGHAKAEQDAKFALMAEMESFRNEKRLVLEKVGKIAYDAMIGKRIE